MECGYTDPAELWTAEARNKYETQTHPFPLLRSQIPEDDSEAPVQRTTVRGPSTAHSPSESREGELYYRRPHPYWSPAAGEEPVTRPTVRSVSLRWYCSPVSSLDPRSPAQSLGRSSHSTHGSHASSRPASGRPSSWNSVISTGSRRVVDYPSSSSTGTTTPEDEEAPVNNAPPQAEPLNSGNTGIPPVKYSPYMEGFDIGLFDLL